MPVSTLQPPSELLFVSFVERSAFPGRGLVAQRVEERCVVVLRPAEQMSCPRLRPSCCVLPLHHRKQRIMQALGLAPVTVITKA